jgi:LysM repeat protein
MTLLLLAGVMIASAQDSTYTVRYGDVLDIIAASVDMSADCIAELSGIENPNKLRPGDTLVFSDSCPPYDGLIPIEREATAESEGQGGGAATTQRGSSGGDYVVERGDVLDLIAAQFDVSVSCLAAANAMANPGVIFPGDALTIDLDCPPYDGEAFVTNPRDVPRTQLGQGGGGITYTVEYGDTLDSIGAAYNLSPSCLGESNELADPSRIFPGDPIVIDPACPPYDGLALALLNE